MEAEPVDEGLEALEAPVGRAVDEAVDLVALVEQQLGEIAAVLAADPGDQRAGHRRPTSAGTGGSSSARS